MKTVISRILGRSGNPKGANGKAPVGRLGSRQTGLEPLEARRLLTDIQLNTTELWELNAALDWARNDPDPDAEVIYWADNVSGTVFLTGSELAIPNNVALRGGGRITLNAQNASRVARVEDGAAVTLDGLTFTGGNAVQGGGIYNGGHLTLTNSTVTGNTTPTEAGGIFNANNSSLAMTRSRVVSNTAPIDNGGGGGGMYSQNNATVTIDSSTIADNSTGGAGGGVFFEGPATLTITSSTISGNTSAGIGGGIYHPGDRANLSVANCTIVQNSASSGGGVYANGVFANSTIAYNHASFAGGGLQIPAGNSILASTIVSNNMVNGSPGDIFGSVSTGESYNNLIGDGGTAGGLFTGDGNDNLTGVNPQFDSAFASDHGGPTLTIGILAGSAARDTGLNTSTGGSNDQRGAPFVRDANLPDIGAFEYQGSPLTIVVDTVADENDGNYNAGDLSIREAIFIAGNTAGGDTITFSSSLNNRTITLASELSIADSLTISGPGADLLTVSGGGASRVFSFSSGTSSVSGIRMTAGSSDYGGAILNLGTLTLTGVAINSSLATGAGGAIYNDGPLTIIGSTISGNSADASGGITNSSNLVISQSTISGNVAHTGSGGITSGGQLTLTNSTIQGNSTDQSGGGGINNFGTATILNSTFAGNVGASSAGGIVNNGSTVTLTSTLVAGNTGGDVGGTLDGGSSYNLIGDANSSGGLTNGANNNIVGVTSDQLKLGTLGNNGGSTQTVALLTGSPAIGAGSNPLGLTTDQRGSGFARAVGAVDIGAYESEATTLSIVVDSLGDDNDGNYGAGQLSLREAILQSNANTGFVDTITFSSSLSGVITLGAGELTLTDGVTITGPSLGQLVISGGNASRILTVNAGVTATISGLFFTDGNDTGDIGGGAINNLGTLTLTRSIFTDNTAASTGGAIQNTGTLTVELSAFTSNTTPGSGGAIENMGGTLTVRSTSFTGNSGAISGGAIDFFTGTATIETSTFSANIGGTGGAIFTGGTLVIRQSTFTGNEAGDWGGAIAMWDGSIAISNSTIVFNVCDSDGNGLANEELGGGVEGGKDVASGVLTIISSIIAGNTSGAPGRRVANDINLSRGATLASNSSYNLIGDAVNAGGLTNGVNHNIVGVSDAALGLESLASIGGPTQTMALKSTSRAINMGSNSESFVNDQRGDGYFRVRHGNADIGAFESAFTTPNLDPFAAASGQLLGASAGPSGNINITAQNATGLPIVLQQQGGSTTWTGSDLQAKTNSPQITGEVVTWVDSKDNRNYAAAMTTAGLCLFTNTSGSIWTYRNLNTEVTGASMITGNLTVFTTTDNKVHIAGTSGSGDLIDWGQIGASTGGNYQWIATNRGAELRAQGLSMPQFSGRITSFVTPWNALNVVGLDANGQIQAVWWHQSLNTGGRWTTNNLSAEYGAPTLTGGLTVWQTSWNAINIAGTDTNGKLSATWWVPNINNGNWQTNNLTDDYNGPLLQASSMTSWVTSWGAMNVAGRESDGTIGVYWWVPGHNNNQWQVEHFREEVPGATLTVGPVSGVTSLAGTVTMSILSTSATGDILRLWWNSATNTWAEQNLTQMATSI